MHLKLVVVLAVFGFCSASLLGNANVISSNRDGSQILVSSQNGRQLNVVRSPVSWMTGNNDLEIVLTGQTGQSMAIHSNNPIGNQILVSLLAANQGVVSNTRLQMLTNEIAQSAQDGVMDPRVVLMLQIVSSQQGTAANAILTQQNSNSLQGTLAASQIEALMQNQQTGGLIGGQVNQRIANNVQDAIAEAQLEAMIQNQVAGSIANPRRNLAAVQRLGMADAVAQQIEDQIEQAAQEATLGQAANAQGIWGNNPIWQTQSLLGGSQRRNFALGSLANNAVAQQIQEELQNEVEQAVQQDILNEAINGQGLWESNQMWSSQSGPAGGCLRMNLALAQQMQEEMQSEVAVQQGILNQAINGQGIWGGNPIWWSQSGIVGGSQRRNAALAQLALNNAVAQQVQEEMQNAAEQAVQQEILDQATNGRGIWQNSQIWRTLQRGNNQQRIPGSLIAQAQSQMANTVEREVQEAMMEGATTGQDIWGNKMMQQVGVVDNSNPLQASQVMRMLMGSNMI